MFNPILLVSCIALSGCATSLIGSMRLVSTGEMRVEPADSQDYDFKVSLRNGRDFGYDGDDPEDQRKVIQQVLRTECRDIAVIDTREIRIGEGFFGFVPKLYVMKIKCTRI